MIKAIKAISNTITNACVGVDNTVTRSFQVIDKGFDWVDSEINQAMLDAKGEQTPPFVKTEPAPTEQQPSH